MSDILGGDKIYTVENLPTPPVSTVNFAERAFVTDATTPAFGVAPVGGGAVTVPVFFNGVAWVVG
jgi:hypothetical protein